MNLWEFEGMELKIGNNTKKGKFSGWDLYILNRMTLIIHNLTNMGYVAERAIKDWY